MDYESIHGPGISNFSSSSPHRMPTVSAAQALQDLKSSPMRCISTGLPLLDCGLQNRDHVPSDVEPIYGGVSRGKVTEIYGPPGVGKSALGMQLAASSLHSGEGVIWVDASHPLSGPRFSQILSSFRLITPQPTTSSSPPLPRTTSDMLEDLTHFSTPTLAHLIALVSHPSPNFPLANTSLIIIDSFATLISNAFPRTMESTNTPKKPGAPNPSARKFAILQWLINNLQKLAATRNIAIVIFAQCVTKMRPGAGAVLTPAINATAWEQGLGCRVALFRDWGWDDEEGNVVTDVRFADVIKAEGMNVPDGKRKLVSFTILETGLMALNLPPTLDLQSPHHPTPHVNPAISAPNESLIPEVSGQKRKLSATDLEIPDSEGEDDEDYGWAEEDEEDIPAMPPQWQGSEDILVPGAGDLEVDEDEEREREWVAEKDGLERDLDVIQESDRVQKEVIEDSDDELA